MRDAPGLLLGPSQSSHCPPPQQLALPEGTSSTLAQNQTGTSGRAFPLPHNLQAHISPTGQMAKQRLRALGRGRPVGKQQSQNRAWSGLRVPAVPSTC